MARDTPGRDAHEARKRAAAKRKRLRVRRKAIVDQAAVDSIFLPNQLTGGSAKGGKKGKPAPLGQVAKERKELQIGVGDEDRDKWARQPDQKNLPKRPRRGGEGKVAPKRAKFVYGKSEVAHEGGGFVRSAGDAAGDVLKSAARDVIHTANVGSQRGTRAAVSEAIDRPVKEGKRAVRASSDLAVGPELTKFIAGEGFNPKWAIAEGLLLPANLFAPLKSVTVGTRVLRGAKGTAKGVQAARKGATAAEAAKIAKESAKTPVLRVPRRQFKVGDSVAEIAAARSRTGRAAEKAFDRARPVTSKVGVGKVRLVKDETQKWAQATQSRLKFGQKVDMLPGVRLRKVAGHLKVPHQYALRSMAMGVDPLETAAFHIERAVEAPDQLTRAAHMIHADGYKKAAKFVVRQGDELELSPAAPFNLKKSWELLPDASESREAILKDLGLLNEEDIAARIQSPGRIIKGAKYTPEEEWADIVIRRSPNRQMLREAMEGSGVPNHVINAQLDVLDTQARSHWERLKKTTEKRLKEIEAEQVKLLDAEADGDEIDDVLLRNLEDEAIQLESVLKDLKYDDLYDKLGHAQAGHPDALQAFYQAIGRDINYSMQLFDPGPAAARESVTSAVTREALQAKHQGDLPDRVDSVSIADEILASDMSLPAELREPGALAARLDEIFENVKGGTDGRFWYDTARRVSKDIASRYADRGLTQDQVAQVIAIYSQAADTVANMSFVREAIDQFYEHGDIFAGRFPKRQSEEAMRVLRGEPWEGRKRSSFYANIMSDDDKRVTVDRWVTRWFTPDRETPDQYYDAYETAIQRMADQLGWEPKEVQAAAWVTSKKLDLAKRRPKWSVDQIDQAGADAYDVGFERYFGQQGELLQGKRIHPAAKRAANEARKPDGGGTLRKDLRPDTSKTGYFVALGAHEQVVPARRVNAGLIQAFRDTHMERLDGDRALRVGIWHNPEDGNVYFDLSKRFNSRKEAEAFAREQGQLAVWDVKGFRSIPTGLDEREANRIKVALRDEAYGVNKPLPVPKGSLTPNPDSPSELWDRILEQVAVHRGYTSPKTGKLTKDSIASAEAYLDDFVARNPDHPESVSLRRLWDMVAEERLSSQPEINFSSSQFAGDLEGLPTSVKMGGEPLTVGHSPELRQLADGYMREAGLPYSPPRTYALVDEGRAARIADEYERMLDINDPAATDEYRDAVYRSYQAFAKETMDQYDALTRAGYRFEFYPEGRDPYPLGPREAIEDLKQNKHLYVFPTEEGFGAAGAQAEDVHPLLADSGVQWGGKPATYNDVFRAVHDVFGHGKEGVGFRWDGEENAWRSHVAMYSDEAKPAMTSETRGQNSWVNFGPHGAKNRNASQTDTVYAEQKAGIMPEWTWKEGAGDGSLGGGSAERLGDPGNEGLLLDGSERGVDAGVDHSVSGSGHLTGDTTIQRDNDSNFLTVKQPLREQLQRTGGGFLHGAHVPPDHPVSRILTGSAEKSAVSVSENSLTPIETWVHELSHFWQRHLPGMEKRLERILGPNKENWVEAYLEYVLDLYPQRSIPRGARNAFDQLSEAMLREAEQTGGTFIRQGMPRELAELFDATLWHRALKGGTLRGAEDYAGGRAYTPFERGFPVSVRHPLASTRSYMRSMVGLFSPRKGGAVGKGFVDPSTVKQFRGYLLENGWYKADVTKASADSLAKAVKMDVVSKARLKLLEIASDVPTRADDVPIKVNPSRDATHELKRWWETVEEMPTNMQVKHLDIGGLKDVDATLFADITRNLSPDMIDGMTAERVAADIVAGVREPIENIAWVPAKAIYEGDMFSNPKAFFTRGESWGQLEVLGDTFDVINDFMKATLLQLNPAYMGMNLLGNLALNLMQQGPLALMNLPRAAMLSRELTPDLAAAVDHFMGRGISHVAQTRTIATRPSRVLADITGEIVDKIPRRAAFLHEAWAQGYRSADDIAHLLTNPSLQDDLYEVTQRANDAIIDYERLSPLERKIITRTVFIYPWIKGATRYTFRFPLEHPVQAMAMAVLYERQQAAADSELGERPWYSEFLMPVGEVERFGETYPQVVNPKQLIPFTTPLEFGQALAGAITGNPDTQPFIEILQPFYPALATSLTGWDSFEEKEVGRGARTLVEEMVDIPIVDRLEKLGQSDEERAESASNRLYPRNEKDELLKTFLGTLAPTPYNPEKGQHYAEGRRGATQAQKNREKWDQISRYVPPALKPQLDAAFESKVEYDQIRFQTEGERSKMSDGEKEVALAGHVLDIAAKRHPDLNAEELRAALRPSTAGEIRGALEELLGWNLIEQYTEIANEVAEARAEGAVVSGG